MKYYRTKREKAQDRALPMTTLPDKADAIGLDVGKAGFHISIPMHGMPPATWAVWYFDYKDNLSRVNLTDSFSKVQLCRALS